MPKSFIWDPHEDQSYSDPEPNELSAASFNKDAGKTFSMVAPAGTLTLLCRQSSVWGGTTDNAIPPTAIKLESGALVMRGISSDTTGVDFTMGPYPHKRISHPFVNLTMTDASFVLSNFDKVSAGGRVPPVHGMQIDILLDLAMRGSSRYQVDCVTYSSTKRLNIGDSAAFRVRAKQVALAFSDYRISPTTVPQSSDANDDCSLNIESTGGTMEIAEARIAFEKVARSLIRSGKITLRKDVRVAAVNDADVQFVTDAVEFYDEASTATFSISDDADIEFDTYSGGKPFDFLSHKNYPEGLFNFRSNCKGKFTLYGAGSAFDKSAMLSKHVVAIDGVPQSTDQRLKFEYVRVGNTQNMVVSLK